MGPKFKIGDVIKGIFNEYTVLDIIFDEREVYGKWPDGRKMIKLKDSYILISNLDGFNYHSDFVNEYKYSIIISSVVTQVVCSNINSSCPQCNGELKDHYSEWAGKDIKKCKTCGWC